MSPALRFSICFLFIVIFSNSKVLASEVKNGFQLSGASVPSEQIFQGGPPRDGIPSIDRPVFVPPTKAVFLADDDRVLGLEMNGEARAYPVNILNWHEIVNDKFKGQPIVITFCPLCGTGMAFDAKVGDKHLEFGVSGLLYQSDVLLYDRYSESLWSQVMREAVTGTFKGTRLTQLPLEHTTWKDWRMRFPETSVLSTDTGYHRDYARSPYQGYVSSSRIYFDVNYTAPRKYHPKENVLGIELNGVVKAYPFTELSKHGKALVNDTLGGQKIQIHWNELARSAYATDNDKKPLVTTTAFWFAWYTFHPETDIFQAP